MTEPVIIERPAMEFMAIVHPDERQGRHLMNMLAQNGRTQEFEVPRDVATSLMVYVARGMRAENHVTPIDTIIAAEGDRLRLTDMGGKIMKGFE